RHARGARGDRPHHVADGLLRPQADRLRELSGPQARRSPRAGASRHDRGEGGRAARARNGHFMKRWAALAIALITGAVLRLTSLERAPAGLDVDEAVNAWNAWCVAETGRDQHGVSWPIKDTAGFGQGTTTLYMYVVAPFYRAFGFTTVWT